MGMPQDLPNSLIVLFSLQGLGPRLMNLISLKQWDCQSWRAEKILPLPFLSLAQGASCFAAAVLNQTISARLELTSLWSVEKAATESLSFFSASY